MSIPLAFTGAGFVVLGFLTDTAWLVAFGIVNLLLAWADA